MEVVLVAERADVTRWVTRRREALGNALGHALGNALGHALGGVTRWKRWNVSAA
jgi:hypothetical protein